KGVTTRGEKMTSEAARCKEINEQEVKEKPHNDGVENKSLKTMNERCSTVLLNELPLKEKDPGSFAIPCQVLGKHKETKALALDHSSRVENLHMEVLIEREIADEFFDEHLIMLKSKSNKDEP
ncbi:hypothetical protein Tco_1574369, partial [Tanacetum coccineum]